MNNFTPSLSLTYHAVSAVRNWNIPKQPEHIATSYTEKIITIAKRIVSEIAYIFFAIVGAIETGAYGLLSFIASPLLLTDTTAKFYQTYIKDGLERTAKATAASFFYVLFNFNPNIYDAFHPMHVAHIPSSTHYTDSAILQAAESLRLRSRL